MSESVLEIVRSSWFFWGGLVYVTGTIIYVAYRIQSHLDTTNKRLEELEEKTSQSELRSSTMVVRSAVNRKVVGSSPTCAVFMPEQLSWKSS